MDPNVQLALFGGLCFISLAGMWKKNQSRKKRRWWVRPILQQRQNKGDGGHLIEEMRLTDVESFFNYTRMTMGQFDNLLNYVGPLIKKHSIRESVPESQRLIITLRYLATGDSYSSIGYSFRIAKSTIGNIVRDTTNEIWNALQEDFLPVPNQTDLINISKKFLTVHNMPNCVGAIDGKHVVLQAPAKSGSLYFNYKKQFSIVLLAVCDADCLFTYVDIGAYGSESDGGILRRSEFGKKLFNHCLSFRDDSVLPATNTAFPYYIIGDEAFPLKPCLLQPYGGRNLPTDKANFNECLSMARRLIENACGILVSRFRIYHRVINGSPETVKSIVKATIVLHNYIKKTKISMTDIPPDVRTGDGFQRINQLGSNNATSEAISFRDTLKDYINDMFYTK